MVCVSKFFEGCLPQISLGPILNTFTQISFRKKVALYGVIFLSRRSFYCLCFNFFQRKVWRGFRRNNQSVGELWVGFFRFYVEKFNFLKDVVTTRQMACLTKFQKSWTRSSMAIEGKAFQKDIL